MPFKKGQSGNPGGRPQKSEDLADHIRAVTSGGRELVDRLLKTVESARKDSDRLAAIKILMQYAYGKPRQLTEVAGEAGPVQIIVETGVPDSEVFQPSTPVAHLSD